MNIGVQTNPLYAIQRPTALLLVSRLLHYKLDKLGNMLQTCPKNLAELFTYSLNFIL